MSKEQKPPEEEPSIEDMVFDLAWRVCTENAGATIHSCASYEAYAKAMDRILESDAFTAELDAMQDRIEEAILHQTCPSCGGPLTDEDDDDDDLVGVHGRN